MTVGFITSSQLLLTLCVGGITMIHLLFSLITSLQELVDRAAGDGKFSGVVMLAKDGQPQFARAYGFADAAKTVKNRVDTKFNLGSINKVFTQVAIGQLAAAGKLSLDDTVRKHLPDNPS